MPAALRGVLLVSHSADPFTIDRVQAGVTQRGLVPIRRNTDRFPADVCLTTRAGPDGMSLRLRGLDGELPVDEVGSVWLRRVVGPPRPSGLSDLEADQCVRESRAALE